MTSVTRCGSQNRPLDRTGTLGFRSSFRDDDAAICLEGCICPLVVHSTQPSWIFSTTCGNTTAGVPVENRYPGSRKYPGKARNQVTGIAGYNSTWGHPLWRSTAVRAGFSKNGFRSGWLEAAMSAQFVVSFQRLDLDSHVIDGDPQASVVVERVQIAWHDGTAFEPEC